MTFLDGAYDEDKDGWDVMVAPRGLDRSRVIYFLRKRLTEQERAKLAAAGCNVESPWYLRATDDFVAVAWADLRAAVAMQASEGGEILPVTLDEAMARAAKTGTAFVLRAAGREYLFDLTRTDKGRVTNG